MAAVAFSFRISSLDQIDLQLYLSYLRGDVFVIDDLENGLCLTIAVTEHDAENDEKKKHHLDVSVKQRR